VFAQSSVTLYGIIDEAVSWVNSVQTAGGAGHSQVALQANGLQPSRWGLRGTEDLGGGSKAVFVLENGFDPTSGKFSQGGLEFGRQVYVGLSNPVGTVTFGRQYDSVVDYVGSFVSATQWAGITMAHGGDLDNLVNSYRTNNAVKYASPVINGFRFGGMYSFGGVAGDLTRNQIWSLGAGFSHGPLSVGAAYLNVRQPNLSFFGNSATGTPSAATANNPSPVIAGFLSAHSYQNFALGASYNASNLIIGGAFSNVRLSGLGDTSAGPNPKGYRGSVTFNSIEGNLRYMAAADLSIGVAYDYLRQNATGTSNGATYQTASIGADYFLSKRTDLYTIAAFQHASGTASTGGPAVADLTTLTPSSGKNQSTARIGVRHRF
jgi:predicted porin